LDNPTQKSVALVVIQDLLWKIGPLQDVAVGLLELPGVPIELRTLAEDALTSLNVQGLLRGNGYEDRLAKINLAVADERGSPQASSDSSDG